jgi:hypothetical protein
MAKCNAITHVAFLKREDFISLLKEFPEDYVQNLQQLLKIN